MRHLIIAAALLLSGCIGGIDHSGFETRGFGVDREPIDLPVRHFTMPSAQVAPYCAKYHGRLIHNGPGCAFAQDALHSAPGDTCTIVTPADGITPERLADLTAFELALCKGWHPAAAT